MSTTNARTNVVRAEQEVTDALNTYGQESTEYKKALKRFAETWLVLTNRQEQFDCIFDD